ncbi:MAG: PDZ domain-containing protein [Clostridiales bacterium]|nr:PDZ domain-containing protein [Candidatus Coliplasma equi]
MFKKKLTPFLCVMLCFAVCVVTFVATFSLSNLKHKNDTRDLREKLAEAEKSKSASLKETFGDDADKYLKLLDVIGYIDDNYIRDYDKSAAWANVYKAYAYAIGDNYSDYFTSDEYAAMTDESDGDFVGIGVHAVFDPDTEGIYIFGVMPSSPAESAGIQNGDIIVEAMGVKATAENYYDMLDLIRGEAGTEVELTVLRDGENKEFKITRRAVPSQNVLYENLGDGVGYITILTFSDSTLASQFEAIMEKAKADGCDKFIFDVRNNSGGYLTEIIKVLDYLLPEGVLINIVDADGKSRVQESDKNFLDAKMVVLCNKNTASAAELFTAALRDFKVSTTVGVTTFGKGTMQTTHVFEDGSAVKTSTAYYNPPCNVSYDAIGVSPDVEVKLDEKWEDKFYQMPREEDTQLAKAIEIIKAD